MWGSVLYVQLMTAKRKGPAGFPAWGELTERLQLRMTQQQVRRWRIAAKKAKQSLNEWIRGVLDKATQR